MIFEKPKLWRFLSNKGAEVKGLLHVHSNSDFEGVMLLFLKEMWIQEVYYILNVLSVHQLDERRYISADKHQVIFTQHTYLHVTHIPWL